VESVVAVDRIGGDPADRPSHCDRVSDGIVPVRENFDTVDERLAVLEHHVLEKHRCFARCWMTLEEGDDPRPSGFWITMGAENEWARNRRRA
jgi:hypothetical protein